MTATLTPRTLTPAEIEHFLEHGYVHLKQIVPREEALRYVHEQLAAAGMDADRPETWSGGPMRSFKATQKWPSAEKSPKFWGAACQLLGGVERLRSKDHHFDNGMTANLNVDEGKPWAAPSNTGGWHKDGYFFRHFLDSCDQGLLGLMLWSDVVSKGGATYFAPESIAAVAKYLAAHPEGVHPNGFPREELMRQCPTRLEAVGEAGDIYLMHSFMLHTVAPNPTRKLRCIANWIVALAEPMNFNRPDPAEFSPLEQAVLRGLGVERLDFKPTRERLKTPDWSPLPPEEK